MSGSRTQTIVWSVVVGVLGFSAIEMLVVGGLLQPPQLYYAWGAGLLVPFVVYGLVQSVAGGSAGVLGRIHQPADGVVPPARQYSQAESLVVRGQHRRAVQVYEAALKDHPRDFEPYLRIARIYRDKLNHLELAVRWYERARDQADLNDAQAFLVSNEIVDIHRNRLPAPRRELEELERLVERFPNHPGTVSAGKELRRLRDELKPPRA